MPTKTSVLVTGCSSGFGTLIARTLADNGYEVYASMRGIRGKNADAAASLSSWAAEGDRSLQVVELDVTDDASVAAAATAIQEKTGGLDVVINNAGVVTMGIGESFSIGDYSRVMDVNVYGPLRVTQAFLPEMREKGDGLLINVSSIMGQIVLPFAAPYTASKWALEGIFESLRYELNPLGIDTVMIQPGAFPTEIGSNAIPPSNPDVMGQYGPTAEAFNQWMSGFEQIFTGDNVPVPQDVADAIKTVIETPKGKRPFRVVVDTIVPDGPVAVNKAHDEAQAVLFETFGLSGLREMRK